MFVIVRTERPRDEVAPFILPKISAATGGDVRGIRSEIQLFSLILQSKNLSNSKQYIKYD